LSLVRRRLLALLAVPALVVTGAGCADDVSPAARVGDVKVGDDELMDEVEQWAHNAAAFDQSQLAGLDPGTYPMRLVDVILQQRIDLELHRTQFEELDLELDDSARSDALAQLFQGDLALAQQALEGFSEDYAARYVDDIGRQVAVEQAMGQEAYASWRIDAYRDADIEVSPRYGRWDPEAQSIVAPEGPTRPTVTAP
jgi:hypothetical protein